MREIFNLVEGATPYVGRRVLRSFRVEIAEQKYKVNVFICASIKEPNIKYKYKPEQKLAKRAVCKLQTKDIQDKIQKLKFKKQIETMRIMIYPTSRVVFEFIFIDKTFYEFELFPIENFVKKDIFYL